MSDPNAALPIAGWYPDPEHETQDRWWDGANWSDHRRPRETAPAAPAAPAAAPAAAYAYVPAGTPDPYGSSTAPYGAAPLQPYGAAQAYPYAYAPQAPQNVPALVGFILALCGFVLGYFTYGFLPLAGGIVSVVGLVKAAKMRRAGLPTHRYGMALTGVLVGFISAVLSWAIFGIFFGFLLQASMYPGY